MKVIYTDGAYSMAREQGGIGIVITENDKVILEYSEMFQNSTNNRMEMLAVIQALEQLEEPSEVTIVSDSQYVIGCASKGWKRKKNVDLWQRYDIAAKDHTIIWEWTKGHNNNPFNERADVLAVQASHYVKLD